MVQRNDSIEPGSWESHSNVSIQAWQPCSETHEAHGHWNLILCEDLDDLPIIGHCAACGAILGSVCGEGEHTFEGFPFN